MVLSQPVAHLAEDAGGDEVVSGLVVEEGNLLRRVKAVVAEGDYHAVVLVGHHPPLAVGRALQQEAPLAHWRRGSYWLDVNLRGYWLRIVGLDSLYQRMAQLVGTLQYGGYLTDGIVLTRGLDVVQVKPHSVATVQPVGQFYQVVGHGVCL